MAATLSRTAKVRDSLLFARDLFYINKIMAATTWVKEIDKNSIEGMNSMQGNDLLHI